MMKKSRAFTLIELLVVISIIALLVAILMPALNSARQQATGAVCVSHVRALTSAYSMYADSYEGKLIGGYVPRSDQADIWFKNNNQWVYPAFDSIRFQTVTGIPFKKLPGDAGWREQASKVAPTLQDRITGLKMGTMWKYAESADIFHCPGDQRMTKGTVGSGLPKDHQYIYRSYSIPDALSSQKNLVPYYLEGKTKISDIKRPSESYNFVEEQMHGSTGFNYNHGGWSFQPWNNHQWWDPLATYHNNAASFGFVDGHAEMHKWEHKQTWEGFKTNFYYGSAARTLTTAPVWNVNIDFKWLWLNYPDKHPIK